MMLHGMGLLLEYNLYALYCSTPSLSGLFHPATDLLHIHSNIFSCI